jgi:hypothetical protein
VAASIFEAGGLDQARPGEPVGDWHPTRYTPSLNGTEEFPTEGDRLLPFAAAHWSIPDVDRLTLDEWQRWLIRHVLEVYPPDWPVAHLRGQLRFRQVVISMGRQNGKSLLAALLVLYLLVLHVRGPRVIGLASLDRQAKIVYDRVRYGIDQSPALSREIRTTGTRGIWRRDNSGLYQTLPADEESAQGEPASGAIYDELHLGLAALWDALVLAQRARRNALLIGITTAGDESSDLLIRLYREGEAAIDGDDERFGFFVWEAPDDTLTEAGVIAANPAVACGRVPLDLAMSDAVKMWNDQTKGPDGLTGRQRCIRYTLNRFIQGAADAWASVTAWRKGHRLEQLQHTGPVIYGLDRTLGWEFASIVASSHAGGRTTTHLVAGLVDASYDTLLEACLRLARRDPDAVFTGDATTLGSLLRELRSRGYEVWILGATEMHAAAQHTAAAIGRQTMDHPGDLLVGHQMARGRRRTTGDSWRLSRSLSQGDIDSVVATVTSAYVAAIRPVNVPQVF